MTRIMNLLNVRKLASIRIQCFEAFLNHFVAKSNKIKRARKFRFKEIVLSGFVFFFLIVVKRLNEEAFVA